ncbi:hypothetical protein DVH05_000217 [Phytophthora capsici]|nr:hypothetical protein DVH05_000217 [Phytophthora capsici]
MEHRKCPVFKVAQLQKRWSMTEAATIQPLIEATIQRLAVLGDVQGGGNPPVRLNDAKRRIGYVKINRGERCENPVLSDCEKYNIVHAEVSPTIDAMQRLPSHKFYKCFADLRHLLDVFKQKWEIAVSFESSTDEVDDDLDSDILREDNDVSKDLGGADEPSGRITAAEFDLVSKTFSLDDVMMEHPSQVDQPDLEISDASQQLFELENRDSLASSESTTKMILPDKACEALAEKSASEAIYGSQLADGTLQHSSAPLPVQVAQLETIDTLNPGVEVIKLHQATTSASTASVTKTNRTRRATINLHCDCPVDVEEFLLWIHHFPDKSRVSEIIDRFPVLFKEPYLQTRRPEVALRMAPACYNHLIPRSLLTSIRSALVNWELVHAQRTNNSDGEQTAIDLGGNSPEPVAILATHGEFTRRYIDVVKQIFDVRDVINSYQEDIEWVCGNWSHFVGVNIPLYNVSCMPSVPAIAHQVAQLLAESWLTRKFALRAGATGRGGFVQLTDVVGRIAGKTRLSDAVLHCASQHIFSHQKTACFAMDPVHVEQNKFVFPASQMTKYGHIIVPVYMRSLKHWLIQIVSFVKPLKEEVMASDFKLVLYDPLGLDSNIDVLRSKWKSFTLPLLQAWHARDSRRSEVVTISCSSKSTCVNTKFESQVTISNDLKDDSENDASTPNLKACSGLPVFEEDVLLLPRQPDSVSCGVLCLAQAYSHVIGDPSFKQKRSVSHEAIDVMRLCIMWQILCDCDEKQSATAADFSSGSEVQAVNKKINQFFKASARSEAVV